MQLESMMHRSFTPLSLDTFEREATILVGSPKFGAKVVFKTSDVSGGDRQRLIKEILLQNNAKILVKPRFEANNPESPFII